MMTDPTKGSSGDTGTPLWHEAATHVVDLLIHYGFDLGGNPARQLIDRWQATYSAGWVRWAVIEALYQGRYKAVSVEQILQLWQRRQQPCYHFNYEFERLVCHKFPRDLSQPARATKSLPPADPAALPPISEPSRSASPPNLDPPAWAALAEQIQQEAEPLQSAAIDPIQSSAIAPLDLDPLEAPEILLNRVARLQAGVEALIEQATSSLNASTEAMKTKLQPEENAALTAIEAAIETRPNLELPEEVHPPIPIHQFMPTPTASEFHIKLKAVVETEAIDSN